MEISGGAEVITQIRFLGASKTVGWARWVGCKVVGWWLAE
jgi:hypothetical protein